MKKFIYRILILAAYLLLLALLAGLELKEILEPRAIIVLGFGSLFLTLPEFFAKPDSKKESPAPSPEELNRRFLALGLTRREAEVALLIYQKKTNHEIAEELFISETTVKKHVTHIFEKLGIEKREQIAQIVKENPDR